MRTARRLFVAYFLPCLLAAALSGAPAVARGEVQFLGDGPIHPILGGITDDPGPFNRRIQWSGFESNFENMSYIPQEEHAPSAVDGDPPNVQFNPISGFPIAAWTAGEGADRSARGQDLLFSHFTVGGWAAPRRLAEGVADPSLSIDPADGTVHLVYWTPNDGGGVWHRQAPADLTSWTVPVRVSDAGEVAAYPTAHLHAGTLSIAYESHLLGLTSTPRDIVLAQRPLSGSAEFLRTVVARTDYAGRNWVRLDSDEADSSSDSRRQLLVRWVHAENQAGWILQEGHGGWGPVGLMPLVTPDRVTKPGTRPATSETERAGDDKGRERVWPGR